MTKVLFINSKFAVKHGITHIPLSLAYSAAVLEKNKLAPDVIDLSIQNVSFAKLTEHIKESLYNTIVVHSEETVLQRKNFIYAINLVKKIKAKFPKIFIIMTGAHVTFRDIETLTDFPQVDAVVRHEPEYVLLSLIKALNNKSDLSKVKGITYRLGQKIIKNPDSLPITDLDKLPIPARHLFPIKDYLKKDTETMVQASRGCTNKCIFCQSTFMSRCLRFRSIPKVVQEVDQVLKLGFKSIFFADYDFGIQKERVIEFCQTTIQKKIPLRWSCNMRADRFLDSPETRKMLDLMSRSGCYRVFVGFETFSAKLLKEVHKQVTPNMLDQTAKILKEYNIGLHASFLFGLPSDTEKTIKNTVKIAKKICPDLVSFNILTPYPGTPLGDYPEKYGLILEDKKWYINKDYLDRAVCGTKNLSRQQLEDLTRWAYQEFLSA